MDGDARGADQAGRARPRQRVPASGSPANRAPVRLVLPPEVQRLISSEVRLCPSWSEPNCQFPFMGGVIEPAGKVLEDEVFAVLAYRFAKGQELGVPILLGNGWGE